MRIPLRYSRRILPAARRSLSSSSKNNKPPLCVVDLRGAGWSLLERLCVEEFLEATKTKQSWLVIGSHEPTEHRHLQLTNKAPAYMEDSVRAMDHYNPSCAIVMEDEEDLDTELVQRDGILCLTGPSSLVGSPSVVLDHSSILTTLIPQEEDHSSMDFMTQQLWKPTFDRLEEERIQQSTFSARNSPLTMVLDTKSCSKGDNSGRLISLEDIHGSTEEDEEEEEETSSSPLSISYQSPNTLLLGEFPLGRIHSDSTLVRSLFWWDYEEEHLEYLRTRPKDWKLGDVYPQSSPSKVLDVLQSVCRDSFEVTQMNPRDISRLMAQEKTGLQDWWDRRSSWKIVQQF